MGRFVLILMAVLAVAGCARQQPTKPGGYFSSSGGVGL